MIMNELANGWLHVFGQRTGGEIDGDPRHIKTMKHDPYNEVNQNSVDDLLQTPNFRNRLSLIEGGTSLPFVSVCPDSDDTGQKKERERMLCGSKDALEWMWGLHRVTDDGDLSFPHYMLSGSRVQWIERQHHHVRAMSSRGY